MKGRSELYREALDAESVALRAMDTLNDRIAELERERDQLRYERDILMAERALQPKPEENPPGPRSCACVVVGYLGNETLRHECQVHAFLRLKYAASHGGAE